VKLFIAYALVILAFIVLFMIECRAQDTSYYPFPQELFQYPMPPVDTTEIVGQWYYMPEGKSFIINLPHIMSITSRPDKVVFMIVLMGYLITVFLII